MIEHIENGELGSSVMNKFNLIIDEVNSGYTFGTSGSSGTSGTSGSSGTSGDFSNLSYTISPPAYPIPYYGTGLTFYNSTMHFGTDYPLGPPAYKGFTSGIHDTSILETEVLLMHPMETYNTSRVLVWSTDDYSVSYATGLNINIGRTITNTTDILSDSDKNSLLFCQSDSGQTLTIKSGDFHVGNFMKILQLGDGNVTFQVQNPTGQTLLGTFTSTTAVEELLTVVCLDNTVDNEIFRCIKYL